MQNLNDEQSKRETVMPITPNVGNIVLTSSPSEAVCNLQGEALISEDRQGP
jgi:hypothetical protein